MGKKGKKAQAGKPKKLTAKDIRKRLDALIPMLEEELKGADLFAPLPPTEPCPICLVPLSRFNEKSFYMACCGSHVCQGCDTKGRLFETKQFVASAEREGGFVRKCALCREPIPDDKGFVRQLEALASRKSSPRAARALYNLGANYLEGDYGMPKDVFRALEYFIQAADVGSAEACYDMGRIYHRGDGEFPVDIAKASLFFRAGALRGCIASHFNAGNTEYFFLGNHEVGIRYWKIAAEAGDQQPLNCLRMVYSGKKNLPGKEFIAKDELDGIYRDCHEAQESVKSEERGKYCQRDTPVERLLDHLSKGKEIVDKDVLETLEAIMTSRNIRRLEDQLSNSFKFGGQS